MNDSVRLAFKLVKMQQRFLDRKAADHLHPVIRRFFMRAGSAIRLTARRLLKVAPQKQISQLSRHEKANYETATKLYKANRTNEKPRRPERVADKGKPPFLHAKWDSGTSPLKHRLWFALKDDDRNTLLIGPAAIGKNRTMVKRGGISTLRQLEAEHPFMEPAFLAIQPRFADYLQQAAR